MDGTVPSRSQGLATDLTGKVTPDRPRESEEAELNHGRTSSYRGKGKSRVLLGKGSPIGQMSDPYRVPVNPRGRKDHETNKRKFRPRN